MPAGLKPPSTNKPEPLASRHAGVPPASNVVQQQQQQTEQSSTTTVIGAPPVDTMWQHVSAAYARQASLQCFVKHTVGVLSLLEGVVRSLAQGALSDGDVSYTPDRATAILQSVSDALIVGRLAALVSSCWPASSREHQQLYSLLFSMLKLDRAVAPARLDDNGQLSTQRAVAQLLSSSLEAEDRRAAQPASSCVATGFDPAVPELYRSSSALWALPSLSIVGRWWLQRAVKLQQMQAAASPQPSDLAADCEAKDDSSSAAGGLSLQQELGQISTATQGVIKQVQCWLQHPSISEQLAAAGYEPAALLQQLTDLSTACHAVKDAPADDSIATMVQQLQVVGVAFTSLAIPVACCNPLCADVSGPSEKQLVSGRGCVCGGCRTARYCSRSCQKQHWSQHKPVCQALKQAAAAAGGGAAAAGGGVGVAG